MRVVVDAQLCEGHARCEELAPDLFEVGEDDLSRTIGDHVREDRMAAAEAAVLACPRRAIMWADGAP